MAEPSPDIYGDITETVVSFYQYMIETHPEILSFGTLIACLAFFINLYVHHRLASSRNKKAHKLTVEHEKGLVTQKANREKEKEIKLIMSLLGDLANDILNCWEKGSQYAHASNYGPPDNPITPHGKINLRSYKELRPKLIEHSVFPTDFMHRLNRLPDSVEKINKLLEEKSRSDVGIRCHHFSEQCKALWEIVATVYGIKGGNVMNLTMPMPFDNNSSDPRLEIVALVRKTMANQAGHLAK